MKIFKRVRETEKKLIKLIIATANRLKVLT